MVINKAYPRPHNIAQATYYIRSNFVDNWIRDASTTGMSLQIQLHGQNSSKSNWRLVPLIAGFEVLTVGN